MRAKQTSSIEAVLVVVVALTALAGCTGGPPSLPRCEGRATPINVVQPPAGSDVRGG